MPSALVDNLNVWPGINGRLTYVCSLLHFFRKNTAICKYMYEGRAVAFKPQGLEGPWSGPATVSAHGEQKSECPHGTRTTPSRGATTQTSDNVAECVDVASDVWTDDGAESVCCCCCCCWSPSSPLSSLAISDSPQWTWHCVCHNYLRHSLLWSVGRTLCLINIMWAQLNSKKAERNCSSTQLPSRIAFCSISRGLRVSVSIYAFKRNSTLNTALACSHFGDFELSVIFQSVKFCRIPEL